MIIKELEGKDIAIVAMGESQLDFHLSLVHSETYDEVWGINCMGAVTKCDRVFMLDPPSRFLDTEDAGTQTDIMRKWLPNTNVPIYTCTLDKRVPSSLLYPIEEVAQLTDCAYFNNTVPYSFAFAIYQKVNSIKLFGIDYSYKGNLHFAEAGKACCEFWLAKCIQAGVIVKVAARSGLLDTDVPLEEKLYGYHRLEDPDILIIDDEGTYRLVKLSFYYEKLKEQQLQEITEIRTVLEGPPEARRY
jgi:hypothetical protein|tara:strand:+ start:2159 stop:2893 length:735 start_codon:yes stop_codon:yes gene_type:complete